MVSKENERKFKIKKKEIIKRNYALRGGIP
jgi:hypothetical protein